MLVKELAAEKALGHTLLHNLVGPEGKKLLPKGRTLEPSDLRALQAAGIEAVQVAVLEPDDLREDEAATELARAVAGAGLEASSPRGGRVDLLAGASGLFLADRERLSAVNALPGIGVATLRSATGVKERQRVATVKVIPYALPHATLEAVRRLAGDEPLLQTLPYSVRSATLVTTGPEASRGELAEAFGDALRDRLSGFGAEVTLGPHATEEEGRIGDALKTAAAEGPGMILVAGKTSIADEDDLVPRAIRAVGGEIIRHGVPVEPGSLLLLAYWGRIPVVGVPGCVKGRRLNAFDLLLPRLLAGVRLSASDLAELGYGGLLD